MKTIVVAGDLIWDHNLVQHQGPVSHHQPLQSPIFDPRAGGAWYLEDILKLAASDLEDVRIVSPDRKRGFAADKALSVSHAYSIWSLQDREVGEEAQVWRIRHFLGCQEPPQTSKPPAFPDDVPDPDILVLDDLDLGFRDRPELWPASLKAGGNPRKIVVKTYQQLVKGKLWRDPDTRQDLLSRFADRLTVVLSARDLRARGAAISKSLSWDLAIEEIAREFEQGPSADDLARCRRVIVHFGDGGAAVFSGSRARTESGKATVVGPCRFERFLYHPEEVEGSHSAKHPGQMFGATSVLTASVVRHELYPADYPLYIAIGRGLHAIRVNLEHGAGAPDEEFSTTAAHSHIQQVFHPSEEAAEPAFGYSTAFCHHLLFDRELSKQPATESDLLRDLTGAGLDYLAAKATEVVLRGREEALRGAPKARYGRYLTVDRNEIERINAIRSLIAAYQKTTDDRKPLSIAVFGPPGSGKSFAIRELADEMFGKNKTIKEFNLSQFSTVQELHDAFHQVRDAAVYAQIPLVFWDEFDSAVQGAELGWLKEFLAPMQDAEFRAGSLVHPFGKAIFIFAGGTKFDFESFSRLRDTDREKRRFQSVKGPDFISRLRGFVNIKGPNPAVAPSSSTAKKAISLAELRKNDPAHLIRRAILLRAALERFAPHLIDSTTKTALISSSVIRGFLQVGKYVHGARSLEAVVQMSDLAGEKHFGIAELPSADLLQLHVSSDFMDHVRKGEDELPIIEALSEAHHDAWHQTCRKDGWKWGAKLDEQKKEDPLLRDYTELSEREKDSSRLTARVTQAKLATVGYHIQRPKRNRRSSRMPQFSRRALDQLTRIEHDVWLRDHLLKGYEWAESTNKGLRLHRDVTSFDSVREEDQRLDRELVKSIPKKLWVHGYTLVKQSRARRKASGKARPTPARRKPANRASR